MPIVTRTRKELGLNVFASHPPGIKFVRQFATDEGDVRGDYRIYVLEREPTLHRVSFRNGRSSNDRSTLRRFKIRTPWVYFIGVERAGMIYTSYVWFAKNQAKDLSEPIFLPPLPNIKTAGNLCLGGYSGASTFESLAQVEGVLRRILHHFFTANFNMDVWVGPRIVPKEFRRADARRMHQVFEDWEKRSKDGSEITWKQFRRSTRSPYIETLDDAINYAFKLTGEDDD
jgi:hypothetical protein